MDEQTERQMVQARIMYRQENVETFPWAYARDPETARKAVDMVMGEGRTIERDPLDDGADGIWLVEFTEAEIEVLEDQGYIDLAKGPYEIVADTP